MTQEEQDLIRGRAMRQEHEARQRLECLKNKAGEMADNMRSISDNLVTDVLNEKIAESGIEKLPSKDELLNILAELREADLDLAKKMEQRAALDLC